MATPSSSSRLRWFYLDDQHADYNDIITSFQAISPPYLANYYQNVAGKDANRRMVRVWMSDAEVEAHSPTLAIGASNAVKEQFNYAASDYPFDVETPLVNVYGGEVVVCYGKLRLKAPDMPTYGEDRRIAHYKGEGSDTVLYVAETAAGTGDGSSYLNRKAANSIAKRNQTDSGAVISESIVVFSGDLGNGHGVTNEIAFYFTPGTSDAHTIVITHPVDRMAMHNQPRIDKAWTDNADGTWTVASVGNDFTFDSALFVWSTDSGEVVRLSLETSLVDCRNTINSMYHEPNYSGSEDRVTVHLESGNDPRNTTYFWGVNGDGLLCSQSHCRYISFFGLKLYGAHWSSSSFNSWNSDWHAYGCSLGFTNEKCIAADSKNLNESTGAFTGWPTVPHNRHIQGCHIHHVVDGLYDHTGGHQLVPKDTTLEHNLFEQVGGGFSDLTWGSSDSHCMASMGHRGMWRCWNNRIDNCGWTSIFPAYATSHSALIPYNPGTSITNGTFNSDISGWTDQSTGDATISWDAAGKLSLNHNTGVAIAEQALTVAAADQGKVHLLRFDVDDNKVDVRVGTTSGATDVVVQANVETLYTSFLGDPPSWVEGWDTAYKDCRVAFTPNTETVYLQIRSATDSGNRANTIDNVIIDDQENTEGYTLGFTPETRSLKADGTQIYTTSPCHESEIAFNWITNIKTRNEIPGLASQGRLTNLAGEFDVFGDCGTEGTIHRHVIHDNIYDGEGITVAPDSLRAIITKWYPKGGRADGVQIYRNIFHKIDSPIRTFGISAGVDDSGDSYNPCYYIHHNLFHDCGTGRDAQNWSNTLNTRKQDSDCNNYSYSGVSIDYNVANGSDLATWQASAPDGMKRDQNSVVGKNLGLPVMPSVAGRRVSSKDP